MIDEQIQDFTIRKTKFHFIFGAMGKSSFCKYKPLLTENGIYISTELRKNVQDVIYALTTPMQKGKRVLFPFLLIINRSSIFQRSLLKNGKFKPVIDQQYRLDEIVGSYKYVESGKKAANVFLKIVD